jgi:hypothetical protein
MDQWQWLNDVRTFFDPPASKIHLGSRGLFGLWPISVSLKRFNTHLYVVGASGQGKSKLLQHVLFELTTKGHGCGVFDPHSDLAHDLLAQLAAYPKAKPWLSYPLNYRRILYLDPSRSDYIIPCNILKNLSSSPYEIAENVVESFRRVWPETLAEAPRFAQIMRNAVLVLIANQLSLLELEPLLTDRGFRRRLLTQVTDPLVVSFFERQFDKWGREQAIFVSPVLNKVTAFLFKPQVRLMLGAEENRLDFRKIIDSGTLLILNLGCFRDEETQRLLGSLFLTSLEQAAFSRSNMQSSARQPFYCMIDEFPLFCSRDSTSLARILSECRKYRLHLGLAHQTITQLPGERIQGALENAKLKIVFGTGRQTAESIVKELFMPNLRAVKHEVKDSEAQERTHPVFDPMLEQFERFTQMIQRLRRRKVLVKLPERERVYRLRVVKVPQGRLSAERLEEIKKALAKHVGKPSREIEEEIAQRAKDCGVPYYLKQDKSTALSGRREEVWQ